MEELVKEINEGLNCGDAFVIPLFGGIHIAESVFVTWIIMAVMVVGSILLTRNLKLTNCSKRQLLLEAGYTWLYNFFEDTVGENGKAYIPYLITVIAYIGIANIFGIFGFKSPTKDLNVTAALALMSIVIVQIASIRQRKVGGWIKSFGAPVAIVAPINILELGIRPLSLCMRLFGNVLGAFVIMKLIECVLPVIVPAVLSVYFDFFDGLIQAYVFTFLTALYIKEAVE